MLQLTWDRQLILVLESANITPFQFNLMIASCPPKMYTSQRNSKVIRAPYFVEVTKRVIFYEIYTKTKQCKYTARWGRWKAWEGPFPSNVCQRGWREKWKSVCLERAVALLMIDHRLNWLWNEIQLLAELDLRGGMEEAIRRDFEGTSRRGTCRT